MKIDDIIFAIGIILISSLLVFVIYDDITNPYPMDINETIKTINDSINNNISENISISQKDMELVPNDDINNAVNTEFVQKTKTTSQQSSNSQTLTQKSNTKISSVQNYNPSENNMKNNMKNHAEDQKPSSFSNTPNNRINEPNEHFIEER